MSRGDWEWLPWLALAAVGVGIWYYTDEDEEPVELLEVPVPTPPDHPYFVTSLESGTIWQVAPDTVSGPRVERQGWIYENHSEDKTFRARETRRLWMVNCDTGAYRTPASTSYGPDGEVLDTFNDPEVPTRFAVPDTNAAAVVSGLCMEWFDTPE